MTKKEIYQAIRDEAQFMRNIENYNKYMELHKDDKYIRRDTDGIIPKSKLNIPITINVKYKTQDMDSIKYVKRGFGRTDLEVPVTQSVIIGFTNIRATFFDKVLFDGTTEELKEKIKEEDAKQFMKIVEEQF